ncbi:23717_t:CDS:1, partial [Gigaspora margarita]
LLLVDGATSHAVNNLNEYPNIRVHFLPSNTTAHLQPMDAGIINAFKAHYKRLYICKVINDFDIGIEKPNKIDVLQAIWLVNEAWNTISEETVKNCWRYTGILPFRHLVEIFPSNKNFENESINIFEIIEAQ